MLDSSHLDNLKIAVIGLGYVGLPVAVAFSAKANVIGFDINAERIQELQAGYDRTREVSSDDLSTATKLAFSNRPDDLAACDVYIVTVPTPIDAQNQPDLTPLERASETVGSVLSMNNVVVFESTVYPGATEEVCVPILERVSGLTFNRDFFAGYSPERINPGDQTHRFADIVKVTSGSTPEAAAFVDGLYAQVVSAGTHSASSIRVAEAAKVIENTQRDLNIALVNELALIFDQLGLDTTEVLEAAGTKWNFLPFRPGLVGGHCIGVDPYYLTHKAQSVGYYPAVVLAGRRINDGMGAFVAQRLIREMICRDLKVKGAKVLVLGLAFKENCPDLRNTRVVDIIEELHTYKMDVHVQDLWVDPEAARSEYGITLRPDPPQGVFDAVICAVGHQEYRQTGAEALRSYGHENAVFFDLKALFPPEASDYRL